jgi:hypothetical protein
LACPAQSIWAAWLKFYPLACDLCAVVLAFLTSYLGAQPGCRNAATLTNSASETEPEHEQF